MEINHETIDKIKKLSIPEKILIVEEIWNSIAQNNEYPEMTDEQKIELNRRIDSYHANPKQGRAWDEIRKDFMESR
ncbi:MAG: addiction module protein [Desulfobacterales bacterium]|nr:addiction module protein [Desulfobacterales bacterium]